MIGEPDQAARRQNIDLGTSPCSLGTTGSGTDQSLLLPVGGNCCRQHSCDVRNRSVEGKLAKHHVGLQGVGGHGAKTRHQPDCDRQIVMTAFFG